MPARLVTMTEQTVENTRTVEVFLHALQDADLETAGAALAEDLVTRTSGYRRSMAAKGRSSCSARWAVPARSR